MGVSKDNLCGVVLALLSTAFIGASFIIKKKGLKRAVAASGVRAGLGGPECGKCCIGIVWLCCCALWDLFVACTYTPLSPTLSASQTIAANTEPSSKHEEEDDEPCPEQGSLRKHVTGNVD